MYIFEDREVTNPMTFTMVDNGNGTITLTPAPGTVTKEGTPMNKNTMEELQRDIYDTLYPVGHIMIKSDAADYSSWLNFVWERVAEGDALVGFKANDAQYGRIGVEFGSDTVTVSHSGSSGATTLTVEQIPSHNHGVNDPQHGHGVTDPGHGHGVTDPGHSHNVTYGSGTQATNWMPARTVFTNEGSTTWATGASGTGISIVSSRTNIAIIMSRTGISIQSTGGSKSHTHTINHSHTFSVTQKSYPVAFWKRIE